MASGGVSVLVSVGTGRHPTGLQMLLQIVHVDLSTAGRDLDVVIGVGSHQQALLDDPDSCELLEMLETYLDTAGNAQDTDLKDGMERLALHLTLKVARLTGQLDLPLADPDLGGQVTPAA